MELVRTEEEEQLRAAAESEKQAERARRLELVNASAAFRNQLEGLNVAANLVLEVESDVGRYQLPMNHHVACAIVGLRTRFDELDQMIEGAQLPGGGPAGTSLDD